MGNNFKKELCCPICGGARFCFHRDDKEPLYSCEDCGGLMMMNDLTQEMQEELSFATKQRTEYENRLSELLEDKDIIKYSTKRKFEILYHLGFKHGKKWEMEKLKRAKTLDICEFNLPKYEEEYSSWNPDDWKDLEQWWCKCGGKIFKRQLGEINFCPWCGKPIQWLEKEEKSE